MQEGKTKRGQGFFPLRLALLAIALGMLVTLVVWQLRISERREALSDLREQIAVQDLRNEEIRRTVDSLDTEEGLREYAEKKAREELGYAKPGERIFVDVGGSD